MDIQNILLLITAGLTLGVGIFVLLRGAKEKINLYYFLTSLFMFVWCVSLFIFRYYKADELSDLGGRTSYVAGLLMVLFFYLFSAHFPFVKSKINRTIIVLYSLATIYFFLVIYFSRFFIKEAVIINGVVSSYHNNLNYIVHSILLAWLIVLGLFTMYRKISGIEGIYRKRLLLLFFVSSLAGFFGFLFDVVYPYFMDFSFNWLGPLFLTLMALAVGKMIIIENK